MTFAQRKQERHKLVNYLLTQDWNVFGTLKFVNGRTIGSNTANLLLRSYWNRIDMIFFGRSAERQNIRVPRWCFAHEGSDSENFHVHFALLSPITHIDRMCAILNAAWVQHHAQTAPLEKNWIMPVQDRTAVANYLTREYWRMGSTTLLDQISWSQTTANTMLVFENPAQALRIDRAVCQQQQQAANSAFLAQQDKYKQIGDHL